MLSALLGSYGISPLKLALTVYWLDGLVTIYDAFANPLVSVISTCEGFIIELSVTSFPCKGIDLEVRVAVPISLSEYWIEDGKLRVNSVG